jgi:hypothetical protein
MLYFRSEEHVDNWCSLWRLERGAVLPIDLGWQLARVWYGEDRRHAQWRRRTAGEVEAVFTSLGLTGDFWRTS